MHDNNELHHARALIEELKDEKYRLESQLQAAGLRENRFLSEKNKAEDDLKRVTAHLAEERLIWARDIAEKDRVLAHAKSVQEELERKAITEAQKVRSEMSAQVEKFRIDTDFVSQVQERYQALTVEVEASNAKARAKQTELEEREGQLRELQHRCDSLLSERNALAQSSAARLKEVESALEG
ncbi:nuclear distribution protein nudE homolog 1-like [Helianthus annuus]|uniref:nuclear distribution protein nudE homolog 1-like n=1 Tax=Helianthus annuus TaxID=4232 RepID=UPI000B8FEEA8|nr:nuclear distribution protein nudE homolog 1-like [Helianthus annuus]